MPSFITLMSARVLVDRTNHKRTTDLEKMLGQFTNPATDAEEKKKKDKFLAKDKNQNKKGQKKPSRHQSSFLQQNRCGDDFIFYLKLLRIPECNLFFGNFLKGNVRPLCDLR